MTKTVTKNNISTKGFTLIELLVVIAIIGMLSSIVLASLGSARNKGTDASIKEDLHNMRVAAELRYDKDGIYTNVCSDNIYGAQKALNAAAAAGGNGQGCSNGQIYWVAWVGLKNVSTDAWCVDNTGTAKQITKPVASINSCP